MSNWKEKLRRSFGVRNNSEISSPVEVEHVTHIDHR